VGLGIAKNISGKGTQRRRGRELELKPSAPMAISLCYTLKLDIFRSPQLRAFIQISIDGLNIAYGRELLTGGR
jgi:hypothetical protein